jgi:sarcosine oxidase subunit gamma
MADGSPGARIAACGASRRFSLRMIPSAVTARLVTAGFPLALLINRCSTADGRISCRLGPDEWLLVAPETDGALLAGEIAAGLGDRVFSLVDVGHRNAAISVEGPRSREVLNGGCPLDLDDAAFPAGAATRTLFGKAEIVLIRPTAERFYRVECGRSFAPYVQGLLQDLAREFAAAP